MSEKVHKMCVDCGAFIDVVDGVPDACIYCGGKLTTDLPEWALYIQECRQETAGCEICHDCDAKPGEYHQDGCDVEQCPICGGQLLSCGHEPIANERMIWTGEFPGIEDCRRLGFWCRMMGNGFVRCESNDPNATEDLNRLHEEGTWNRELKRFERVAKCQACDEEIQTVLIMVGTGERYQLCMSCVEGLASFRLLPDEFHTLIEAGHTTNEVLLGTHFYDENGISLRMKNEFSKMKNTGK